MPGQVSPPVRRAGNPEQFFQDQLGIPQRVPVVRLAQPVRHGFLSDRHPRHDQREAYDGNGATDAPR